MSQATTCRAVIVAGHKAKATHGLILAVAVSIVVARAVIKHAREAIRLVVYCIGEGKRIADARKEG